MKTSSITDEMLQRMSPQERAKLSMQTASEAMDKFTAKSEGELQKQIRSLLSLRGVWFFQARMDKRTTGTPGTPDFLMNGWAMEVKHGTGKLSEDQIKCHEAMRKSGWKVYVVRNMEEVRATINCNQTT